MKNELIVEILDNPNLSRYIMKDDLRILESLSHLLSCAAT